MQLAPLEAAKPPAILDRRPLRHAPAGAATSSNHSAYLLQRTPRANEEAADPSFWTAYDHFMLEREARELRRAHLGGMLAGAWRRLRELPGRRNRF